MSNYPSDGAVRHDAADDGRRRRPSRRLVAWFSAATAVAAIAVLVFAIVGRDRGDQPTLRAMTANTDMSNDAARAIAENTIRVWLRERNDGHLANLEALTCKHDAAGTVLEEIESLKRHEPSSIPVNIAATGAFVRHGRAWALNTHFVSGVSFQFVLLVEDGELRACRIAAAPMP